MMEEGGFVRCDGWMGEQASSLSLLATGYSSDTQNSFQILRYINSKNQRRKIKLKKTKKCVGKASSTLDSSPSGGGTSGECGKQKGSRWCSSNDDDRSQGHR